MMAESYIRIHELDDINLSNNTFIPGSENSTTGRFTVQSLKTFLTFVNESLTLDKVTANEIVFGKGANLTVATNAITVTHSRHLIDTFNSASSGDLHSILSTLSADSLLLLSPVSSTRSIVIKHSLGNIFTQTNADIVLSSDKSYVLLYNAGTSQVPKWHVIATNVPDDTMDGNVNFVPPVEPTLSLNFSKREYKQLSRIDTSVTSSLIDDVATVTRNSLRAYNASGGKLFFAPIDKIGYCYFPKGTDAGLPIYSETTNLLLHTEDFDNAAWTKTGITSVNNTFGVAPEGASTLNFILPSETTAQHSVRQDITTVIGRTYTTSVYVKTSASNYQLRIRHGSGAGGDFLNDANFDVSSGTVTRGDTNARVFPIPYLGFYRVMLPFTATSTTTRVEFAIHSDNTTASWLPNGTGGLLLWGAQTNNGTMTAYSESVGTSGVSNVDAINVDLTDTWYVDSPTNWTLFIEYYLPELADSLFTSADYRRNILDIGIDSGTQLLVYSAMSSGTPRICFVHIGTGITTQTISNNTVPISEFDKVCKLALSWDGTDLLLGYNGQVSTVALNDGLLSDTYDRIKIGRQTATSLRGLNGKVFKLNCYPVSFTSTELVNLTSLPA